MTISHAPDRTPPVVSIIDQHPVMAFLALAFVLSWGYWGLAFRWDLATTEAAVIPGGFGPAVAAATVTWLRGESVRSWVRNGLDPCVGGRWYAVVIGLPILLGAGLGAVLAVSSGGVDAVRLGGIIPTYPLVLVSMVVVGGGQEELGWRGFALPILQERLDAFPASVAIGIAWTVWHLPLFSFDVPGYGGRSIALYGVLVVGFSILLTWLYNSTSGSILMAAVFHGGINSASSLGGVLGGETTAGVPVFAAYAVPVWILALGLILWFGSETLSTDGHAARFAGRPRAEELGTSADSAT